MTCLKFIESLFKRCHNVKLLIAICNTCICIFGTWFALTHKNIFVMAFQVSLFFTFFFFFFPPPLSNNQLAVVPT